MLLILGLILSVGALAVCVYWSTRGDECASIAIGVFASVALVGFVIGIPVVVHEGYCKNAEMIALRSNLAVYEQAARSLNDVAAVKNIAGGSLVGGIENAQQSQQASAAWLQYRDARVQLTNLVAMRRVSLSNPIVSWLTPPLPVEIQDDSILKTKGR